MGKAMEMKEKEREGKSVEVRLPHKILDTSLHPVSFILRKVTTKRYQIVLLCVCKWKSNAPSSRSQVGNLDNPSGSPFEIAAKRLEIDLICQ